MYTLLVNDVKSASLRCSLLEVASQKYAVIISRLLFWHSVSHAVLLK